VVPPEGAPAGGPRPQGSSVLPEERAGVWPLGPSEMMVLLGVLPRRRGPKGPREPDAPGRRWRCLGAEGCPLWDVDDCTRGGGDRQILRGGSSAPPQRTEKVAAAVGGRPLAHDALVSPDLGSSMVEVSIALSPSLP
jgi:hypothetical protein